MTCPDPNCHDCDRKALAEARELLRLWQGTTPWVAIWKASLKSSAFNPEMSRYMVNLLQRTQEALKETT